MHGEDDLKLLKHNNPKVKYKILLPEIMSLNIFLYDLAKKRIKFKVARYQKYKKTDTILKYC